MNPEENGVLIAATCDLSRAAGDTIRIVSLANSLALQGIPTRIVVPTSSSNLPSLNLHPSVEVNMVAARASRSYLGSLWGILSVALGSSRAKRLLQIEGTVLGFLVSFMTKKGAVLDVHGLLFDEIRFGGGSGIFRRALSWIVYRFERTAVLEASTSIVVSRTMKRYLCDRWGVPPDRVLLVPNGYLERLTASRVEVETEMMTVTYVGQISGWSGLDHILAAAKRTAHLGALFRVIGGGPMLGDLKRQSRDMGLVNVDFTGFQPIERVYEMVSESEVVISPLVPTLALEVACPIKLLEYLALGKPIVVEDVGEIPSMLKELGAALVVPSDSTALAEGVLQLLTDGKARKRLSKMALRFSKRYSWAKQGEKLYNIYTGKVIR